jgi:hypothetical protein
MFLQVAGWQNVVSWPGLAGDAYNCGMRVKLWQWFVLMFAASLAAWWAGERYRSAKARVAAKELEVAFASTLDDGSRRALAAQRHAKLRHRRQDAAARQSSVIYRLVTPQLEN